MDIEKEIKNLQVPLEQNRYENIHAITKVIKTNLRAVHLKIPFCTILKSDQILLKLLYCIAIYIESYPLCKGKY